MKTTEDKIAPKGRALFEIASLQGIVVNVRCPECGEISQKIVYPDELKQEDEKALCPRCHKWRAIKIPELKTELRSLLE